MTEVQQAAETLPGTMQAQTQYTVGIMRATVDTTSATAGQELVARAVDKIRSTLTGELGLNIKFFTFNGPPIRPAEGRYPAFDLLQIGLVEKLERHIDFLLIVSEIDLSSSTISYAVALPSQVTNVGILSVKRLFPSFWGEEPALETTAQRLGNLMLHTLGHLLNLPHAPARDNVMYDFGEIAALDEMNGFSSEQVTRIQNTLPAEAREARLQEGAVTPFVLRQLLRNARTIWRAMLRANPLRLIGRMPTMLAAAGSAMVVLFFSAEVWDVADAILWYQLLLFVLFALVIATTVLYQAFSFRPLAPRGGVLAETTIVSSATTLLSMAVTTALLFLGFMLLTAVSGLTVFPAQLKTSWTSVAPATTVADHFKLGAFLASVGVLAGSLGGRADSKRLVRSVLFLDEET